MLVDLWAYNQTGWRVVHLAGMTLTRQHLTGLGLGATMAPLPLLVALARLQPHGQPVRRRRVPPRRERSPGWSCPRVAGTCTPAGFVKLSAEERSMT